MSDPAVRVAVRPDRVAVLTIDQPGAKVNVLTAALWDELEAAIDALAVRTDLAGLVIASGKPGCFIAGADLHLLANATPGDPAVRAFIAQGLRVLEKLEALPYPTCAAIDGVALGGGLEVALACDGHIAGFNPKVRLGLPEVKLGLIPGWGGTQRLSRLVGVPNALSMILDGESLDVRESAFLGLLEVVTYSEGIMASAVQFCGIGLQLRQRRRERQVVQGDYSGKPPGSAAELEAYSVITLGARLPLTDGIKLETEAFLRLAGSEESRAKIAAFFAARKR